MRDDSDSDRVDEAGAALILERAAKLDAGRGKWLDLRELRDAAVEAGISRDAFDRAVAEVEALGERPPAEEGPARTTAVAEVSPPEGEPLPWTTRALSWVRPGMLVGIGAAFGTLPLIFEAIAGDPAGGFIFGFALAFQVLLYLIWRHRRGGSIFGFGIDLAGLWVGLTFLFMVAGSPSDTVQIAAIMSVVWAVATAVGAGLIALPRSDRDKEPDLLGP